MKEKPSAGGVGVTPEAELKRSRGPGRPRLPGVVGTAFRLSANKHGSHDKDKPLPFTRFALSAHGQGRALSLHEHKTM